MTEDKFDTRKRLLAEKEAREDQERKARERKALRKTPQSKKDEAKDREQTKAMTSELENRKTDYLKGIKKVKQDRDYEELSKTEQEKKDEMADEINIWTHDQQGNLILSVENSALFVIEKYDFITIGEKVYSSLYYDEGYYRPGGEKLIKKIMQEKTKGKKLRTHTTREIIAQIQQMTFKEPEEIYATDKNFICLKNGILNLNTKQLDPHTPKLIFTQQIPTDYNPSSKCPKIKAFLNQVMNLDDIPSFQEFLGFLLIRNYNYKKALIFVGEPDTGKTTLINIIVSFIGSLNKSSESIHQLSKDKFSRLNLKNKLLNLYDDLGSTDIDDTGTFKMVTGNSWLSGEHKFGEREMFQNYAKLLFACNKIFGLKDKDVDDDAYYNRWMIFFFNNILSKDKQDKSLSEKLSTPKELSGLLNWAIEGLIRLQTRNDFSYNKSSQEIKALMQRGSNSSAVFAQDCLIETQGECISKEDLYSLYCAHVRYAGGSRITKEKFGREITKYAPYIIDGRKDTLKKKSVHIWRNVRLNTSNTGFLSSIYVVGGTYHTFHNTLEKSGISRISDFDNTGNTGKEPKEESLGKDLSLNEPLEIQGLIDKALDGGVTQRIAPLIASLKAKGHSEADVDKVIKKKIKKGDWFSSKPGLLARLS